MPGSGGGPGVNSRRLSSFSVDFLLPLAVFPLRMLLLAFVCCCCLPVLLLVFVLPLPLPRTCPSVVGVFIKAGRDGKEEEVVHTKKFCPVAYGMFRIFYSNWANNQLQLMKWSVTNDFLSQLQLESLKTLCPTGQLTSCN